MNKINIFLNNSSKGNLLIQVKLDEKISDIIQLYKSKKNIDDPSIYFLFNGRKLDPSLTVAKAGLKDMVTLTVMFKTFFEIKDFCVIFRNASSKKEVNLGVNPDEKISQIIERYRKKDNNYDPSYKFYFKDKQLNPQMTAEEAGLILGSEIFVTKITSPKQVDQSNEKLIKDLKDEIKALKNELKKKNELIEQQKLTINNLQNKIKNINSIEKGDIIISLKNELINKKNEIIKLKEKMLDISSSSSLDNKGGNVFAVNFISNDQKINYPIVCNDNTLISRLEEEIYNEYSEYKNYNTYLMVNGIVIKRFKTIKENGIKKGDQIIINLYE